MNKVLKTIGRFIYYIFGKALAIGLAVAATIIGFHTAVNTLNVIFLTKDAFAKRTSVILKPIDNREKEELHKVFSMVYLTESRLETQNKNGGYDVTNYYERTDVAFKPVFPWKNSIELEVKDVIEDIRATTNDKLSVYGGVESFIESGIYKVTLVKNSESNEWLLDKLELIETIKPELTRPVPTPVPESEDDPDILDAEDDAEDETSAENGEDENSDEE